MAKTDSPELSPREQEVLAAFGKNPNPNVKELSEKLGTSPNNIYNVIRRLAQKGLIERPKSKRGRPPGTKAKATSPKAKGTAKAGRKAAKASSNGHGTYSPEQVVKAELDDVRGQITAAEGEASEVETRLGKLTARRDQLEGAEKALAAA